MSSIEINSVISAGTIWLEALVFVVLAVAAVPLNLRLARRYQRQLDELDR